MLDKKFAASNAGHYQNFKTKDKSVGQNVEIPVATTPIILEKNINIFTDIDLGPKRVKDDWIATVVM